MDIGAWLRGFGLQRFEQVFRDADVDLDVLPELTDADLVELGFPPEARNRLLKAIAALGAEDRVRRPPPATPRARAERRQLTVLFCDLVGTTELSRRLDPEDLSEVIQAYHDCCARVIGRWDGHIARYLGDGVLAYFGWPQANEDDAERAVRAGLELVAAVARLETLHDATPAARVGIATGTVVVGPRGEEGVARQEEAVGETPNVAARLQAEAAAGTVVVAGSTRRLVGDMFELKDLGPLRLKGFDRPLTAFRVVGVGRVEGRFEALRGGRLTPLVGREHELNMVLERWARARKGYGQVVLIHGEPGIGKSRLVRALRERLASDPHFALNHFCSPYHTNTALHPITAQLERAAGFTPEDGAAAKMAKLRALLERGGGRLQEAVPLIGELLGIAPEQRGPPLNLSPQQRKQRTFVVLVEQLIGLTRSRPVVDVYEDVHWADPTTLELLDLVVDRIRTLPALLVLTYRSDFVPPWSGQTHVTTLPLKRLGRPQAGALVARLTGHKALPDEVVAPILDRTDGVPLLVEEMTAAVLESGLLRNAGDRWELDGTLLPLAIPNSLQDSLMARLDRLGPAKTVAQVAAVLGHSFDFTTIRQLWEGTDDELNEGLDRLADESLVVRWGAGQHANFVLKHALIEEVAYDSLLRRDRRAYHRRASDNLRVHAFDLVKTRPELIARHYSAAARRVAAVAWLKAGRAATRRSANAEALAHLRNAEVELLQLEKAGRQRSDRCWALLHMARAPALIALHGWAVPEVEQTYRSALMLARRSGARGRALYAVWRGLYNVHLLRGNLDDARQVADRLHGIATEADDPELLLGSHRAVGLCDFLAGRFEAAHEHLQKAIGLYDPVRHRHLALVEGTDPAVIAFSLNAWSLWFLGHHGMAVENSKQAIEAARRVDHPFSLGYALCLAASVAQCRGKPDEVASLSNAALQLSKEHAFAYWHAWASMVKGWALVDLEERDAGLSLLEDGLARYAATDAAQMRGYGLGLLAAARRRSGRWSASAEAAREAVREMERTGIAFYLAEACRLRGEALCHLAPLDRSGPRLLVRAVRVAERQRADSLVFRASLSLLERSGREHLRGVALERAGSAFQRMRKRGADAEIDVLQGRLANVMAHAGAS